MVFEMFPVSIGPQVSAAYAPSYVFKHINEGVFEPFSMDKS